MQQRLVKEQLDELNLILSLIDKVRTSGDEEEKNELIKMLSTKHIIIKGHLTKSTIKMRHPEDIEFIKEVDKKIKSVLYPVYDGLVSAALEHLKNWFREIMLKKGISNPKLHPYQLRLIKWLLRAIIRNEYPEQVYTLLISRGGGKSFSLSVCGCFLKIFHSMYILHNNFADFVTLLTAPQDEQLAAFQKNYHEFIALSTTNDDVISYLGRTEKDESLMGLYIKRKSMSRIEILKKNGASYSDTYFSLGSKSIEGKHGNLLLSDESKFLSKKVINGSMLPTMGARNGVFVELSSAHDQYSEYQATIERNILSDMETEKDVRCVTWDEKQFDKNRLDNIKEFEGEFHFQQHWESMVVHNSSYALAVSRELTAVGDNRDDPEFATMYDNRFLSTKSSSFFDLKDLRSGIECIFEDENIYKYIDNNKYTIIAGVDFAVTGDISDMTIKALESGFGENRKTKLLYKYMLNPSKNKNIDSILNQCIHIAELVKRHNITGLALDGSGVGKSSKSYIMDTLYKSGYYKLDPRNVFEIVITSGNRTQLLEYYYNRIQSGLEMFTHIPKEWEDEETMKRLYIAALKSSDERSCWIRFVFEHMRFARTLVKDQKTEQVKIVFAQSSESFMHDDSVFSSALCSDVIKENPTITSRNFDRFQKNTGNNKSGSRFKKKGK